MLIVFVFVFVFIFFTSKFCCVYTENPLFSLSEPKVPRMIHSISGEVQSLRSACVGNRRLWTTSGVCCRALNEALCIDIDLSVCLTFSSKFIAFHGVVLREPNVPSNKYRSPRLYETNAKGSQRFRGGGSNTDAG